MRDRIFIFGRIPLNVNRIPLPHCNTAKYFLIYPNLIFRESIKLAICWLGYTVCNALDGAEIEILKLSMSFPGRPCFDLWIIGDFLFLDRYTNKRRGRG